jgi:biotin carboxyl carrier protein
VASQVRALGIFCDLCFFFFFFGEGVKCECDTCSRTVDFHAPVTPPPLFWQAEGSYTFELPEVTFGTAGGKGSAARCVCFALRGTASPCPFCAPPRPPPPFDATLVLQYADSILLRVCSCAAPYSIVTPMPGRVVKVVATPNSTVEAGATLLIVEAMKMEHTIKAPYAGTVAEVRFKEGDLVSDGDVLVVFGEGAKEKKKSA